MQDGSIPANVFGHRGGQAVDLPARMPRIVDGSLSGRGLTKPPVLRLEPFVPPVREHLTGLHATLHAGAMASDASTAASVGWSDIL